MRILLVYPYFLEERVHQEDVRAMPMGLYTIGAVLKAAGHEVALFNAYGFQGQAERIRTLLERFQPEVVGFSILNANRWGGIEIARLAKAIDVPASRISEIVAGRRAISADTDLRLCRFLGLSPGYWLRAQAAS